MLGEFSLNRVSSGHQSDSLCVALSIPEPASRLFGASLASEAADTDDPFFAIICSLP